jgi:CelD/BcsL family acetyltransferase involved in cellulose biosynthesis
MGSGVVGELVLEPLTDMEEARPLWTELARSSSNVFSTWEWGQTWWKHYGAGRRLKLASAHTRQGRPAALLPLVTERRATFRIARFIGHGVADELGPVCAPADRGAAARALGAATRGPELLLAERLADDPSWSALEGRMLRAEASPVISLTEEGDWDQYLASRSSNFRQQVRRRARKLERGLEVTYRLAAEPARLEADMDALISLHRARWGDGSTAFSEPHEAFHRDFAARALENGWLRLWLAESQGVPVAAWYGLRYGDVESFYQSGRDPGWNKFAVGSGILEHSIREAFQDGMREYRLLRGEEEYKRRYATRPANVLTVATASGPAGRAMLATVGALASRPVGRRVLKRLGR